MPVILKGVKSLAKAGSAKLKGDVTLTGGTNVTITQSGNDISIAADGGGGASYLVYTALVTFDGANNPTATVYENTLGGTVVWTRSDVGLYYATLAGAFPAAKTVSLPFSKTPTNSQVSTIPIIEVAAGLRFHWWVERVSDDVMSVNIYDGGVDPSDLQFNTFIEIRVYP